MTRIFIDANVIIAMLNKKYPLFRFASRVLSLTNQQPFELYTSATCLAIAFCFSCKKNGEKAALQKMLLLPDNMRVANMGESQVKAALANKQIHDFEDGMQYYSAIQAGCNAIITEDHNDFYFSEIPIMNCETYLRQVALPLVTGKQ